MRCQTTNVKQDEEEQPSEPEIHTQRPNNSTMAYSNTKLTNDSNTDLCKILCNAINEGDIDTNQIECYIANGGSPGYLLNDSEDETPNNITNSSDEVPHSNQQNNQMSVATTTEDNATHVQIGKSQSEGCTNLDSAKIIFHDLPSKINYEKQNIEIINQPPENIKYSYPCAVKNDKPGRINATTKVPTALNYEKVAVFAMLCEKNGENVMPSQNGIAKYKSGTECKEYINSKPKEMENKKDGTYELNGYHCIRANPNDREKAITGKFVEYNNIINNTDKLNTDDIPAEIKNKIKVNAYPVIIHYLLFLVFKEIEGVLKWTGEFIYSNPFSNCIFKVKIIGKSQFKTNTEEMITLKINNDFNSQPVQKMTKNTDFFVRLFNLRDDRELIIKKGITFDNTAHSISFQIPKYELNEDHQSKIYHSKPNNFNNTKIECFIEIISKNGSKISQPLKFCYTDGLKRKAEEHHEA